MSDNTGDTGNSDNFWGGTLSTGEQAEASTAAVMPPENELGGAAPADLTVQEQEALAAKEAAAQAETLAEQTNQDTLGAIAASDSPAATEPMVEPTTPAAPSASAPPAPAATAAVNTKPGASGVQPPKPDVGGNVHNPVKTAGIMDQEDRAKQGLGGHDSGEGEYLDKLMEDMAKSAKQHASSGLSEAEIVDKLGAQYPRLASQSQLLQDAAERAKRPNTDPDGKEGEKGPQASNDQAAMMGALAPILAMNISEEYSNVASQIPTTQMSEAVGSWQDILDSGAVPLVESAYDHTPAPQATPQVSIDKARDLNQSTTKANLPSMGGVGGR